MIVILWLISHHSHRSQEAIVSNFFAFSPEHLALFFINIKILFLAFLVSTSEASKLVRLRSQHEPLILSHAQRLCGPHTVTILVLLILLPLCPSFTGAPEQFISLDDIVVFLIVSLVLMVLVWHASIKLLLLHHDTSINDLGVASLSGSTTVGGNAPLQKTCVLWGLDHVEGLRSEKSALFRRVVSRIS